MSLVLHQNYPGKRQMSVEEDAFLSGISIIYTVMVLRGIAE